MTASTAAKPKRAAKPKAAPAEESIVAFKGFDKNLQCHGGYQFEVGKTFEHKGRVKACSSGFHSCENPFDVLGYYPASEGSRFALVRASGKLSRHAGDSKVASASIHIEAELTYPDFIKRAVAWLVANVKTNLATGYRGHAAATGYRGHAAATGDSGHAAATGDSGHAAATGDRGHAAATGYSGHAAATGDSGHAAATGDRGHAAATGDSGHAAATGYRGHAAATGYRGHAAATGYRGHAAATGDSGHAAATGDSGHAAATGDRGHAAATGYSAIAASLGPWGSATAGNSGAIMLAHYDTTQWPYVLKRVGAFMVGENGVEPGKTYRLSAHGKPEEVR
jgi:hypothetical protein